ncbi:MAG: alanine racemase [Candidatus Omnitrophota bacterium]|nr:alanine racemase [Candidatus Omnitrophota bacterium]
MKHPNLKEFYRPTWVEIDLSAVEHNFRLIRKIVGPKVKILAVVKADAYGHGMLLVAKRLVKLGVDYLGVASIDEGIVLRKANIQKPVLLFENILPQFAKKVIEYDLTATVCTDEVAQRLNAYAKSRNKKAKVHIKIDTGMGRLGVWHREALGFIRKINNLPHIIIEGAYTHFPCADSDSDFTQQQISDFKSLIRELEQEDINIPIYHIANSMGNIGYPDSRLDMVRAGLMLYGLYPKDSLKNKIKLRPALSLKSKIIFLKKTSCGRSISYGRTFVCPKDTMIATVPVGYKDGYLRNLSNRAQVLYGGRRYPVVGRICMDQLMVDLGIKAKAKVGDVVTLAGIEGKEEVSLEELAHLAKTINYEIACLLGSRAKIFYRG